MDRPKPKKNAECDQCLEVRPLLMPFAFVPGWPFVAWSFLCWRCRCAIQVSKHWHRYGVPGYVIEHSPHEEWRQTYVEWLANDPERMPRSERNRPSLESKP